MKKHICILLSFLSLAIGKVYSQASTEGKEFWVALTLAAAPAEGLPAPFIAISTKEQTNITITNPNDPSWPGVTRAVVADAWSLFTTDDIPLKEWYPTSASSISKLANEAGKTNNYGLKITTDKDVSVFAALRMVNSFDAANILPITAIQSDYITQDYPPYIKPDDGDALAMFTILATENNTQISITPSSTTSDGHVAGNPYTITLNAGQTYYVISKTLQSLSGSRVTATDGKKIAVFQGDVFTQIPGGKAARDCTYEQAMPTDYWGSQFVVTRSLKKDANRIRVTAMEDDTQIKIDGKAITTLNSKETYEFEMSTGDMSGSAKDVIKVRPLPDIFKSNAVYLQSSCPVAVYSYDVSNGYKAKATEMENEYGDPSMVWISPLEQKINKITFGVCGTDKTKHHYIDIVCLTSETDKMKISSSQRPNIPCNFTTVTGNPTYSYARLFLVDDTKNTGERIFTLNNPSGFIAHVYGNGDDESYAYSVGSAAVKRAINIGGRNFPDGYISDEPFYMNEEITFDAQVGSDIIDHVDWNFGDGITQPDGPVQTSHTYESPGWYDVTATVYAHKACPETTYPPETLKFSFRIQWPECLDMTAEIEENEFCPDEEESFIIEYEVIKGSVDDIWIDNNGQRVDVEWNENEITVPLADFTPDIYNCHLMASDPGCGKKFALPLYFVVRYPASIIHQKWDDVLVIPNSNANGGYEFTDYQWLKNGDTIQNATSAWYYAPDYNETGGKLEKGAEYSVVLTRKDGVTIQSCSMTPDVEGGSKSEIKVAPTMLIPGENIGIQTTGQAKVEIFDMMGIRQSEILFEDSTEIAAPARSGIYILHVRLHDGTSESRQIVVTK